MPYPSDSNAPNNNAYRPVTSAVPTPEFSSTGIRYATGEIRLTGPDLASSGFGTLWGHTRSYANKLSANYQGSNGDRWYVKELPQIAKDGSGNAAVIGIINDALWFDSSSSSSPIYSARFFNRETLTEDTINKEFAFTDTTGRVTKFFNFDGSIP